ncbi:sulfurtransferase, partial [Nostoc sp. NIES-2111]
FVVSPNWLLQHLQDPQVIIVDCRFSLAEPQLGQQQYKLSHIQGAYYLDLNLDLSSHVGEHGGRHPLPNADDIAKKLAAIGVEFQKTLVVAYDDSRFAFASRLWWLLRYLGHEQVAVLDGGFSQWQQAGYPISDIIPQFKTANFVPQIQPQLLVDITDVKTRKDLPSVVLVDSRESDRYRGEREPIDKIAGHIPGAVNYPWMEVTDAKGYLISPTEHSQRWQNIATAEEILVYCGSGVTACVNLLSLELAGIHTGKLYAGSWSDWISY